MLKDITLGQYYPGDSVIHRMDPRFKIIATLLYIVALFIMVNFTSYIFTVTFLVVVVALSKVPLKFILRGMKPIFIILILTFLLNLFLTRGGDNLFSIGFLSITTQGLRSAVFLASRLILLITSSSILTYTTKPIMLTDGIESLLKPFKIIGVPAHELAMMMSIALRFIPILAEEADKIQKAQMARGANFEEGGVIARAKAMVPILVPLFISAFRRATDLAMAMEARCYHGGEGRTKMFPLKYHRCDYIAYAFVFLYMAIIIVLCFVK